MLLRRLAIALLFGITTPALAATPEPEPQPFERAPSGDVVVALWMRTIPGPNVHFAPDPRLPLRPPLMATRDGWEAGFVVLADGTFALANPMWLNDPARLPYVEGRLAGEDLAMLRALARSSGLAQPRVAPCKAPAGTLVTRIAVGESNLVAAESCGPVGLPARLQHLVRTAQNLLFLASGEKGIDADPEMARDVLYAVSRRALREPNATFEPLVRLLRDGSWRRWDRQTRAVTEGRLARAELTAVVAAIRDTVWDQDDFGQFCDAVPTEAYSISFGLAGHIGYAVPCGGSTPGPALTALFGMIDGLTNPR